MTAEVHVYLLGKHELFREGLRRILADSEYNVRKSSSELEDVMETEPDPTSSTLFIIDCSAETSEFDATRRLRAKHPSAWVVLIADDHDVNRIVQAFEAGVHGYLEKTMQCGPLVGALKLITLGEKILPFRLIEAFSDPTRRVPHPTWDHGDVTHNLSDRELEILRCLISGDANKLMARRLNITEATVKVHIKAILRKLRVMNRTQAAIWALSRGLDRVDPPVEKARMTMPGAGRSRLNHPIGETVGVAQRPD